MSTCKSLSPQILCLKVLSQASVGNGDCFGAVPVTKEGLNVRCTLIADELHTLRLEHRPDNQCLQGPWHGILRLGSDSRAIRLNSLSDILPAQSPFFPYRHEPSASNALLYAPLLGSCSLPVEVTVEMLEKGSRDDKERNGYKMAKYQKDCSV